VVPEAPQPQPLLHSYAYITQEYTAGGLWERVEEFDNEQLRWTYSLPAGGEDGTNQLYFFHPGEGYHEGDPRHQSRYMEVLYHEGTVISLFPVPEGTDTGIIGVLPKGQWYKEPQALFGFAGNVYFAIYLSRAYELVERQDYLEVRADRMPGGVVVEALEVKLAEQRGIGGLDEFAEAMTARVPIFETGMVLAAEYITTGGDQLRLQAAAGEGAVALLNHEAIRLEDYAV
jgi:hypothetical protein